MRILTSMKEYPLKLPHGSGRIMTFDPRLLLLAFEEHSSQQNASDRLQKKQKNVPDPISVLLQDIGSAQSEDVQSQRATI